VTSSYPGALDTTALLPTTIQDDVDSTSGADAGTTTNVGFLAQLLNDLDDAVLKIQAELGIQPRGLYASTVRERFEISAYKNQSCRVTTTAALPAVTYANGTAGVGATLTATATGAWAAIDGQTLALGDRILVKDQAAALQNGIYTVTTLGAVGVAMFLTRALDSDTATKISDMRTLVNQGTQQGDTEWGCTATSPTMGTTALPFKRANPIYGHGNPRFPWDAGASLLALPIMPSLPRTLVTGTFSLAVAATQYLFGGIVVPAGRTVTNVNYIATTAGAAPTVDWFALVRQSDRVVQAHTANSTAAPSTNTLTTRALTAPWTPNYDTPVWVVWSLNIATTARVVASVTAGTAAVNLIAPAMTATNGVAPTTTLPTDGTTVITAATTGAANIPYLLLT
jgi:hypothetical protein